MGFFDTFADVMRGLDSMSEGIGRGILKGVSGIVYNDDNEILRREKAALKKSMKEELEKRDYEPKYFIKNGTEYDADIYEIDLFGIVYYNQEASRIKSELMVEKFGEETNSNTNHGFVYDDDGHAYDSVTHYIDSSGQVRYKG